MGKVVARKTVARASLIWSSIEAESFIIQHRGLLSDVPKQ